MNLVLILNAAFLAALLAGAQVMFKLFATHRRDDLLYLQQYFPLAGALGLYFAVFIIYANMLRKLPLSLLYPTYTALSVLFTYGVSVFFFREQVSPRSIAGCVMLIIAIYLIAAPVRE